MGFNSQSFGGGGGGTGGPGSTDQAIIAPAEVPSGGVYGTFATALAAVTPDAIDHAVLVAHEIDTDLGNVIIAGHDGAVNAPVFADSTQAWTVNELVGRTIWNQNDGSFGIITANDATTVTAALHGGEEQLWDTGDSGFILYGTVVPDPGTGIMDLEGVVLSGTSPTLAGYYFEDGAKIKGVAAIGPDCQIRAMGTTRIIEPSGSPFGESVRIERNATLVGSEVAPVIHAAAGESWKVYMFGGSLGPSGGAAQTHPAITQAGTGEVEIYLHGDATIRENSLGGDDGTKFLVTRLSDASSVSIVHAEIIAGAISVDETVIAPAPHAPTHAAVGADPIDVGSLATPAVLDFVPHSNGAGGITMKSPLATVATASKTATYTHTGDTNWISGETCGATLKAATKYKISISAEFKTSSAPVLARVRAYDVTGSVAVCGMSTDQIVAGEYRTVFDIQTPGAGARTYRLEYKIDNGAQTITVERAFITVEEI